MRRTWTAVTAVTVVTVVIGVAVAGVPLASAEVNGASPGQDEAIPGYPVQPGVTYTGAFQSTSTHDDLDYLRFTVSKAGETLQFTVKNTTKPCSDPDQTDCPVYLTLMDSTNHQVGGDSSGAGTIATKGDTETFKWTFAQAGTYYELLESNGDEAAGSPSYSVKFGPPPSPPPPPLVKSFSVPSPQHGTAVKGTLVLGQEAVTLRATLYLLRHGKPPAFITSVTRHDVATGTHNLVLRLTRFYRHMLKRRHHLSLSVKLTAVNKAGAKSTKTRKVKLIYP